MSGRGTRRAAGLWDPASSLWLELPGASPVPGGSLALLGSGAGCEHLTGAERAAQGWACPCGAHLHRVPLALSRC